MLSVRPLTEGRLDSPPGVPLNWPPAAGRFLLAVLRGRHSAAKRSIFSGRHVGKAPGALKKRPGPTVSVFFFSSALPSDVLALAAGGGPRPVAKGRAAGPLVSAGANKAKKDTTVVGWEISLGPRREINETLPYATDVRQKKPLC